MRSWKICTAFGIGVYVHWTFLLLVGFVLYSNWGVGGENALYALAMLLAVFGCVVLHELGHALMARRFGIGTRDITLYPIGGVARLDRMSERPIEEFLIAIAGPAVNVAIAAILFVPAVLSVGLVAGSWSGADGVLKGNMLVDLVAINVMLVLFNLLPAFPMDGGRVLRALLVGPLGRVRATEVAAGLGAAFAVLFGLGGLFLGTPMLMLVGVFAYVAGQQELAVVRWRDANRRARPLYALPAHGEVLNAVPISPVTPPTTFTGSIWDDQARVWIVWHNGRPVQIKTLD